MKSLDFTALLFLYLVISVEISQAKQHSERINVPEPYKTMIKTTTRFALSQTSLPNHLNLETALNIINDIGYTLSDPVILFKAIKVVAITVVTFIISTIFFPGTYHFLERTWRDPMNTINHDSYLEKSALGMISARTEEALSRFGIQDYGLCHFGEALRCLFPESSEAINRFASDNFSKSSYRENKYINSFVSGFSDKNCTTVSSEDTGTCFGNLLNSIVLPRFISAGSKKNKYQTIQAARS